METYRSGEIPEEEPLTAWEQMHDYQQRVVGTEDYEVARISQGNLEQAPAGFRVVYGSNEIALQRFHRTVARVIGHPS
jgi:Ring hydroxylating alpha subunit (catalytic domain)